MQMLDATEDLKYSAGTEWKRTVSLVDNIYELGSLQGGKLQSWEMNEDLLGKP